MLKKIKTWPWKNLKARQYYWQSLALMVAMTLIINGAILLFLERCTTLWWCLAVFGAVYPALLAVIAWLFEPKSSEANLDESFQLHMTRLRLHQWMNGVEIRSTERQLSRLQKSDSGN
jgi:hypothetical protein